MQRKVGGKFHLKLNIGARPIANKYREEKNFEKRVKEYLKLLKGNRIVSSVYNPWHISLASECVQRFGSGFPLLSLLCICLLVPCAVVGRQSQFVCCGKWLLGR